MRKLTAKMAPEAARIAGDHLRRLDRLLPGRIAGFYVVGSTALLEYREGRSDVDFVAVLDRRLDRRELRRLRLAHLWSGGVAVARAWRRRRWAIPGTPNGSFVAAADLARPVTEIVPVASHTGAEFAVGKAFDVNPVVWQTFANGGFALRGPDPSTLGLDPEPAALSEWNRRNLDGYWRSWAQRILSRRILARRRSARWWTAWGVLGAPRLHHTMVTGEVISKEEAGSWAHDAYDDRWHPIIWEAQAYRRGKPLAPGFRSTSGRARLRQAAEFVLEVVRVAVDEPAPAMDTIDLGSPRVTEAVVVWTGWGTESWPSRARERLVERFGEAAANELWPVVRHLDDEFERSGAVHVVAGIREAAEQASSDFRERHPEVDEEVVRALAWCYWHKYK